MIIPTCVTFITHRTLLSCRSKIESEKDAHIQQLLAQQSELSEANNRLKTENALLELKSVPVNPHQSTLVDTPSSLASQQHPMSAFRTPQGMSGGQQGYPLSGGGLSDINMLLLDQRTHHISISMQLHELQTQYRYASGPHHH